jgi:Uri superfamily endonuclease
VLLIEVLKDLKIKTGKLGSISFEKGFYAYVGSALNSLEKWVGRHLRSEKKTFWHIDYLLKRSKVIEVIYAETGNRKECLLARELSFVSNFGCSDCRCKSHLFFSKDLKSLRKNVLNIFRKNRLEPRKWCL